MKLYRKIDTTTGNFLEDVLFETHPILMESVREEITLENSTTEIRVTEQPLLDVDGNTILDNQYVEQEPPQGLYLPRWTGTEWVEGGQAPEPTIEPPSESERIDAIELVLMDLMMGGM